MTDPTTVMAEWSAMFERAVRSDLVDAGHPKITPTSERVLREIGPGGRTVSQIATELELSPQACSKVLAGLNSDGYVTFERDDTDRRRQLPALTDRGRHARDTAVASRARAWARVGADALAHLTPQVSAPAG